jgi:hypothetical protein
LSNLAYSQNSFPIPAISSIIAFVSLIQNFMLRSPTTKWACVEGKEKSPTMIHSEGFSLRDTNKIAASSSFARFYTAQNDGRLLIFAHYVVVGRFSLS